jgi:NAD-dependent SIR2 family protein deacetylase
MIARLSELSQAAEPTPFHHVLRALDKRGKLLRVYTQNIDAIELKSGLSFGIPDFDSRRCKPRPKEKAPVLVDEPRTPVREPAPDAQSSNRLPSPPAEIPRCIPLHGTLQSLHCQSCTHTCPLEDHLSFLTSGMPPQCPECITMEGLRQVIGKRARGVGKLRPSVVLYNEDHKDGEGVGEVVRKDLIGGSKGKGRNGADLLLVVGTSLRVPGTKRIVREFAKAVRSRSSGSSAKDSFNSGLLTPTPSPRRSPATDVEPPVKTVYLNLDFPVPTREWEGVFDVWLQGDAQSFAETLQEEIQREERARETASEKKRKRAEDATSATVTDSGKKKKVSSQGLHKSVKRQKVDTPQPTRLCGKSPSRGKSPSKPPKIFIRIPPRHKPPSASVRKLFVPEVYISTPPPSVRKTTVPTTPSTPTRPPRFCGRTPATKVHEAHSISRRNDCSPLRTSYNAEDSGDESSELSEVPDELPTTFLRTVRYDFPSP